MGEQLQAEALGWASGWEEDGLQSQRKKGINPFHSCRKVPVPKDMNVTGRGGIRSAGWDAAPGVGGRKHKGR